MKMSMPVFIIIVLTIFNLPASGAEIRQISWADLVPARLQAEDPFAGLTLDQRDMAHWVINSLENLPKRGPETEEYYKEIDESIPMLRESGIDIAKLMMKRKELRTAIVEELNGQRVRIPGYLLPLEASGTEVTEFLLVPYVGACIHVPPPPPNQIVYVKVAKKGGYKSKKLFEAVWVAGVISAKSMVKDLFLVDGTADVDIGYSMQADRVEPYKE